MKKFLFFAVAVLAGIYLFPQVYEEAGNTCQALERKALRANVEDNAAGSVITNLALSMTDGKLGVKMAADQYPDLPQRFGCLATYYNFPDDWRS